MSSTKIFEALKNYNQKVQDLGSASVDMRNSLLSMTNDALNNEQFTNHFSGKKNEDYTEFDRAVLSLLHKQLIMTGESKVSVLYNDANNSYKELLELMMKEP
ncbi:hypothetical protein [Photobacterium leiognathi]|uniref:hypothetical protein n=1 Tax=Photobacterium leiognathi TaxID=553611 RepID=UPI002981E8FA|nr:hypothetical protein [Photobacterium leiognathi]